MTSSLNFDNHQLELLPENIGVPNLKFQFLLLTFIWKGAHFRNQESDPEQIHDHDLGLIRYLVLKYKPLFLFSRRSFFDSIGHGAMGDY